MYATPAAIRRSKLAELIIPSAEDFNFADWLVGLGHVNGNIIATLPIENTIGGTILDGYAFQVGDISAYPSVVINIHGQVEGRGGDIDSGNGSNGLRSTMPFTLNIFQVDGGAIQAGGGGGGRGGKGADGHEVVNEVEGYSSADNNFPTYWAPLQNDDVTPLCTSPDNEFNPLQYISMSTITREATEPLGRLGYPCNYPDGRMLHGNFWTLNGVESVRGGSFREKKIPPYSASSGTLAVRLYSVFQGEAYHGVSTRGSGGKGQGYEGPSEVGIVGTSTYRAGKGGNGGDGGTWGQPGATGQDGGTGLIFALEPDTHPNGGAYDYITDYDVVNNAFDVGIQGGQGGTDLDVTVDTIVNYI